MDTKRLYVDFHVLQTVPPSCVNRDDTGSPKTAVYGGATRARVSSQAWKHAIREMFKDEYMLNAEDIGSRTKKIADVVEKQIKLLAPDADAAKLAKKVVKNTGFKVDEKSGEDKLKTLFFLSEAQAKALAELAIADCNDPKQYKDALGTAPSVDMALFGRMVADAPSLNYDAAAQVAHSISTHAVQNELITSPLWMTVPRRIRQARAIWARWSTTLPPCIAMPPSTWWNWCTCWELKRQPRLSGCSAKLHPLHAHRKAEQLCQPHPAGCCLCHPAGGSACEPLRCL